MTALIEKLISTPAVKNWYLACYEGRRDRAVNPEGTFDNAGRWYPDACEDRGDSFRAIRSPTRSWPYSYMLRARTRDHARTLAAAWLAGETALPDDFTAAAPVRAVAFAKLLLPPAARTRDGFALLAGCLDAAPGDAIPWLVFADWLEENAGKPGTKTAALIRVSYPTPEAATV